MAYLIAVSLVWSFSFGLIKGNLAGLDPSVVSFVRMALSLAFFAPFFRARQLRLATALQLVALGAIQYGAMYVLYIASYAYLAAHQVALFTVLTPLFVVAIEDAWSRRFKVVHLVAASLAVGGAAVVGAVPLAGNQVWKGFLLIQAANVCFALGQVWYRRAMLDCPAPHHAVFALPYLGAVVATGAGALATADLSAISLGPTQIWTLLYLGIIASGLCFFAWNVGATTTTAPVLAVFNNVKVPLGVAVSLVVFGESANVGRLIAGGALIALALVVGLRASSAVEPAGGNGTAGSSRR